MPKRPYKVIALCVTKFKDYNTVTILKEMCSKCAAHNIKVIIFASISNLSNGGINDIGEVQIFHSFNPKLFDAVVLMSGGSLDKEIVERIIKRVKECDVPVICVDRAMEGCFNITYDYEGAFEKIVRHIVEDHCVRDVGFISGYRDNVYANTRLNCYKKILEENNIPFREEYVLYGGFWAGPTRDELEKFINSGYVVPRAFVCANDIMAIECMRVLKEHGYRIPEDVLVTGFDGVELEHYYSPRLTTAEFDVETLCKTIFDVVNAGAEVCGKNDSRIIAYNYRVGESCGCCHTPVKDVEEKLYVTKVAENGFDYFSQTMYNMIAKLSNYPDIHYVFKHILDYLPYMLINDFWLCFNEDVLDSDLNIKFDYSLDKKSIATYTPVTKLVHHSSHYALMENDVCDFMHDELLHNLDWILMENDYLLFMPLHILGNTIGYTALSFDVNQFQFDYYQSFLQNFTHIVSGYINRAATERLYVLDMLTGIYNRHGFYRNVGDEIKKSKKSGNPLSIISIDMNGMKKINDNYGHAEGDFALKKISECMKLAANQGEICTRFGGDEFLIAFCAPDGENRAKAIVADMKKRLDDFNAFGAKPYYITASCGVFSKVCDENDTLDAFIKEADDLMYDEKRLTYK